MSDTALGAVTVASSEERAHDRRQAALRAFHEGSRYLTDRDAILALVAHILAEHLDIAHFLFGETSDGESATLDVFHAENGVPQRAAAERFHLNEAFAALATRYSWHECRVVEDNDVLGRAPDDPLRRTSQAMRVRSSVNVPIVKEGRPVAMAAMLDAHPRRWTRDEVELCEELAERAATSIARARAEAALKERDRNQDFLIAWSDAVRGETSPDAIMATTLEWLGRHLGITRATYSESDKTGRVFSILGEWRDGVMSIVDTSFSLDEVGATVEREWVAGTIVRYDDVITDPRIAQERDVVESYKATEILAFVSVPLIENGRVRSALSVQHCLPRHWRDEEIQLLRDVAERTWVSLERARAQAALEERERNQAFLLAWSDKVRRETSPHAIIDTTLEWLGQHLGVSRVTYAESDSEGRVFTVANEWHQDCVGSNLGNSITMGSISASVDREWVCGELVCYNDVTSDPRAEEAARIRYALTHIRAFISVPLVKDGMMRSILSVQDKHARRWRPDELQLMRDIAERAWVTLERAHAETALARSREALFQNEKLSALGSLLAGVSHELNNPLSIVVAQSIMLERQTQGGELAERAQKIRTAADRCSRIVQTFLAMARQKQPEREAVDLNAVAMAAYELAEYGLRTDGIAARLELAPSLPGISADADQLHQVIINLLVNAQQALASGAGPDRTLTLRTAVGSLPRTVILEVADNGPGVPEGARRRIFEPFFTTKPQGHGTGVGLSFSQGLAEAHGGRLELLPSASGACFRLTLPIDSAQSLPKQPATPAAAPEPSVRRALVIDDEAEIAESLADFLSVEGFACELAIGGADAQSKLLDGSYDLIVSDLRMPGIDGPKLHAWLADARPDLAARMAFTTGDTLGTAAARFLAEVKRPVLEKPFMPEDVCRFLKQMEL
jgi:signal transduction histidine kinase/CheY-like chemotaxis protein